MASCMNGWTYFANSFFVVFFYCQEKFLMKEKVKKIARKIRKFKNT
jgi:hypothetical protein